MAQTRALRVTSEKLSGKINLRGCHMCHVLEPALLFLHSHDHVLKVIQALLRLESHEIAVPCYGKVMCLSESDHPIDCEDERILHQKTDLGSQD